MVVLHKYLIYISSAFLPRLLSLAGRPALGIFLVPRHNLVSELHGQFLQPHGLVFVLTCTVNWGTLYRQVCAFPNHVQSIEFTTGGLQSRCTNISRMINGNRMYLSSVLSVIAKGLHTYVNNVFMGGCKNV